MGGGRVPFYFNDIKENEKVFKTYARRMLIRFKDKRGKGDRDTAKAERNDDDGTEMELDVNPAI